MPDALVAGEEVAGRGPGSIIEFTPPRGPDLLHGLRALRHRSFRLFYGGQLISLTGTWMQSLAQSWLVLVLTDSPLALGLVGAFQFLPVLLLAGIGGAMADRLPKRMILLGTQGAEMVLAIALGVLTASGHIRYPIVLALALLLGIANSIDMPTRQAFVIELVEPEDLINAIALNASLFNAARLVGPAIGGLLIGVIGIAGCFFVNGASFVPVLGSLLLIQPRVSTIHTLASAGQILDDLRKGLRYVRKSADTAAVITLVGAVGTFGANFNVVNPILARTVFHVGATGLGWLMAATGLGSLIASIGLAYLAHAPHPRLIVAAAGLLSLLELALVPVRSYPVALGILILTGGAMVLVSASANSYIQMTVPHALRGRVMSIYTMVFVGTTPIGNTLAGSLAEAMGAAGPLLLGGVGSLVATLAVGPRLWRHHPQPHSPVRSIRP